MCLWAVFINDDYYGDDINEIQVNNGDVIKIIIDKKIKPGSGIGSSAASAAGVAVAAVEVWVAAPGTHCAESVATAAAGPAVVADPAAVAAAAAPQVAQVMILPNLMMR